MSFEIKMSDSKEVNHCEKCMVGECIVEMFTRTPMQPSQDGEWHVRESRSLRCKACDHKFARATIAIEKPALCHKSACCGFVSRSAEPPRFCGGCGSSLDGIAKPSVRDEVLSLEALRNDGLFREIAQGAKLDAVQALSELDGRPEPASPSAVLRVLDRMLWSFLTSIHGWSYSIVKGNPSLNIAGSKWAMETPDIRKSLQEAARRINESTNGVLPNAHRDHFIENYLNRGIMGEYVPAAPVHADPIILYIEPPRHNGDLAAIHNELRKIRDTTGRYVIASTIHDHTTREMASRIDLMERACKAVLASSPDAFRLCHDALQGGRPVEIKPVQPSEADPYLELTRYMDECDERNRQRAFIPNIARRVMRPEDQPAVRNHGPCAVCNEDVFASTPAVLFDTAKAEIGDLRVGKPFHDHCEPEARKLLKESSVCYPRPESFEMTVSTPADPVVGDLVTLCRTGESAEVIEVKAHKRQCLVRLDGGCTIVADFAWVRVQPKPHQTLPITGPVKASFGGFKFGLCARCDTAFQTNTMTTMQGRTPDGFGLIRICETCIKTEPVPDPEVKSLLGFDIPGGKVQRNSDGSVIVRIECDPAHPASKDKTVISVNYGDSKLGLFEQICEVGLTVMQIADRLVEIARKNRDGPLPNQIPIVLTPCGMGQALHDELFARGYNVCWPGDDKPANSPGRGLPDKLYGIPLIVDDLAATTIDDDDDGVLDPEVSTPADHQPEPLQPHDPVRRRSDNQQMTVEAVEEDGIRCRWTKPSGLVERGKFKPEEIVGTE